MSKNKSKAAATSASQGCRITFLDNERMEMEFAPHPEITPLESARLAQLFVNLGAAAAQNYEVDASSFIAKHKLARHFTLA